MDLSSFRDPKVARELIDLIARLAPSQDVNLMEVCGTHTVSIARYGIKSAMPNTVHLISGPGCPVCVTDNRDIDTVIALSRLPQVTITTFGDMMRVPGSTSSLFAERAAGHDIRVVYSPMDALAIAQAEPDRQVVFVGVGFETTTPLVGTAIKHAKTRGISNFSVFCAHKNVPGALDLLARSQDVRIDGFILPGHVSTITGTAPYTFLSRDYGIPGVVTGFEPVDVLQGIAMLLKQISEEKPSIDIAYKRGVHAQGNPTAIAVVEEVFEECDALWRGLGVIGGSGYRIRDEFADFDAMRRLEVEVEPTIQPKGCRCGDVLRGLLRPDECPLFAKGCTSEHPIGPCMVSSEGSCAAYYRYTEHD